jgi:ribonuclease HII
MGNKELIEELKKQYTLIRHGDYHIQIRAARGVHNIHLSDSGRIKFQPYGDKVTHPVSGSQLIAELATLGTPLSPHDVQPSDGPTPPRRKSRPTFAAEQALWEEGHRRIAGVDEVGVGPGAGPLIAAAVLLPISGDSTDVGAAFSALADAWSEVRDSKNISSDSTMAYLDRLIRKSAAVGIGVVEVGELETLDENATRIATERAIEALPHRPSAVLLDGGVAPPRLDLAHRNIPKQDGATTSISISAASIVANVHFNNIMRAYGEQYPVYGFAENKGYLVPRHRDALLRHGACPIHHLRNKVVRRILSQRKTTT